MKKAVWLALLASSMFCCQNQIAQHPQEDEKVKVKLELTSETGHTDRDLTKAVANDITAIQVQQRTNEAGSKYKSFCYGIFDNPSELTLELNKGYLYKLEITTVVDAKNRIATTTDPSSGLMVIRQPFTLTGSGADNRVQNKFIYTSSNYLNYISQGYTALPNASGSTYSLYNRPTTDRYYGVAEDFLADGAVGVKVETKRVVFGLKYEISGFNEGVIVVKLASAPAVEITPQSAATQQNLFTFNGSVYAVGEWVSDFYSEQIAYTVTWRKTDGTEVEVAARQGEFMRKKLYNLVIDLSRTSGSSSVEISKENGKLEGAGDIIL